MNRGPAVGCRNAGLVKLINRLDEPPWGACEQMTVVAAAAVGNPIFDVIGARLRSVPFTPDKVKAAMGAAPARTL